MGKNQQNDLQNVLIKEIQITILAKLKLSRLREKKNGSITQTIVSFRGSNRILISFKELFRKNLAFPFEFLNQNNYGQFIKKQQRPIRQIQIHLLKRAKINLFNLCIIIPKQAFHKVEINKKIHRKFKIVNKMAINKSQQFLYFQNKAKHYDAIKNMRSSVKVRLEERYMKTLSFSQRNNGQKSNESKAHRLMPLLRQMQIKEENEKIISRILKMHQSPRTEVNTQGNYSRFNHEQRRFRSTNPYRQELNRSIQIGNSGMQQRLKKVKPIVGSSTEWSKHFGKTLELKKNLSRYMLESSRSKCSLHISVVDSYVPKYYETFLNTSSVLELDKKENKPVPTEIQITHEGLLTLPNIKSKQTNPAHSVRHSKDRKKLIFDASKSRLIDNQNKSKQSLDNSINPEKTNKTNQSNKKLIEKVQKKDKRKFLDFKFTEVNPNEKIGSQRATNKQRRIRNSEMDESTLKCQQSQKQPNEIISFSLVVPEIQNPPVEESKEKEIKL